MKYEVSMGTERLVVESKQILFEKIEALVEGLGAIKQANSPFTKYPMQDDETTEQWYERVLPKLMEDESARLDGETTEAYVKRLHTPKLDTHKNCLATLQLIGRVFDQAYKVTDANFSKTSFPDAMEFIVKVFKACRVSTQGYE
jgi:hypothetical protein